MNNTNTSLLARAASALGFDKTTNKTANGNHTEETRLMKYRRTADGLHDLTKSARAFLARRREAEIAIAQRLETKDFALSAEAIARHRDSLATLELAKQLEPVLQQELASALERTHNPVSALASAVDSGRRQVDEAIHDHLTAKLPVEVAGCTVNFEASPVWQAEVTERRKFSGDSPYSPIDHIRTTLDYIDALERVAAHMDACQREIARCKAVLAQYTKPAVAKAA